VTDDPFRTISAASVRLRTADGGAVDADLAAADRPWAGAVVCHPHPAYGGDRHNHVVDRVFRTLAAAGVTAARFDFRLGESLGTEQADVLAALDLVAETVGTGQPEVPLWLVGYSFGADIALSVGDERVAGWAAVAPPLRFGSPARPAEADDRPVLVVAAEHDQFNPPERLRGAVAAWPSATVEVAPMADHFLAGAAGHVADEILAWLRARPVGPAPEVTPPR
jgi:alpha/beta superfamily hydrolase